MTGVSKMRALQADLLTSAPLFFTVSLLQMKQEVQQLATPALKLFISLA